MLFFIQGDLIVLGGILFILANLAFGAAIVFYNAFLPDIASPNKRDSVSSQGFAFGYLGGGVLLLAFVGFMFVNNNTLALTPERWGAWFDDPSLARTRAGVGTAGAPAKSIASPDSSASQRSARVSG